MSNKNKTRQVATLKVKPTTGIHRPVGIVDFGKPIAKQEGEQPTREDEFSQHLSYRIKHYSDKIERLQEGEQGREEVLKQIVELCGAVNFSSHNQMREAIEVSLELAENALSTPKEQPIPNEHIKPEYIGKELYADGEWREKVQPVEPPLKGMSELKIYKFQVDDLQNTLRLVANLLKSRDRKTCLDRDIMQCSEVLENVLNGIPEKTTSRF